jgi:starch phosphorylase
LADFNDGHYSKAVEAKDRAEAISSVLYPNDNHDEGKELRLKQQYFFVAATLQDIMKRYKKSGDAISKFDSKVAVQLNDTHPTIAIPELMRLFLDEEKMSWDEAWDITTRVFGYTNHTILPEALEKWSVPLMQKLLPRHLEIIYEINHRHLQVVEARWPGDTERLIKMSIIQEGETKMVRMAILATVGSHAINGVAEIHSGLVKTSLFPEFVELTPAKFQNKTNGVTPRRWILQANPSLSKIISEAVETDEWVLKLDLLRGLKDLASNKSLQQDFRASKQLNKARLAALIKSHCGVEVSEKALFDVQIKRIHEYKRQLLNILSLIYRYICIKRASPADRAKFVPRVAIFAGKAAPGYYLAKRIIHLINAVGAKVNNDPEVGDLLKVVFIPNYSVSLAEVIIPANDISQHISTAGMEASGTSNMKFVMNGGLIVGTMDGANIEIAHAVGRENMFVFGASSEEVEGLRHDLKHKGEEFLDERLLEVYHAIEAGEFGPYEEFEPILYSLREGRDYYLLAHDWPSYLDAQDAVDQVFVDESEWTKRCIASTSMMGVFSSDRTIAEYAKEIWSVTSSPVHL